MAFLVQRMLSPLLVRLGSRTILGVGGALFLLNMLIPDPIPLVDEFLILAGTILLSRWAQEASSRRSTQETAATRQGPKHVGRGSTSGT